MLLPTALRMLRNHLAHLCRDAGQMTTFPDAWQLIIGVDKVTFTKLAHFIDIRTGMLDRNS
ncbi:hypothetical protein D3C71_1963410 [compost metagenome]